MIPTGATPREQTPRTQSMIEAASEELLRSHPQRGPHAIIRPEGGGSSSNPTPSLSEAVSTTNMTYLTTTPPHCDASEIASTNTTVQDKFSGRLDAIRAKLSERHLTTTVPVLGTDSGSASTSTSSLQGRTESSAYFNSDDVDVSRVLLPVQRAKPRKCLKVTTPRAKGLLPGEHARAILAGTNLRVPAVSGGGADAGRPLGEEHGTCVLSNSWCAGALTAVTATLVCTIEQGTTVPMPMEVRDGKERLLRDGATPAVPGVVVEVSMVTPVVREELSRCKDTISRAERLDGSDRSDMESLRIRRSAFERYA